MHLITDLRDRADLLASLRIIKSRLRQLSPRPEEAGETPGGQADPDERLRALCRTGTGQLLTTAVRHFEGGAGATLEELAGRMGVSARKAHSLRAILGRWERNHDIKVFEEIEGRPKRFLVPDDIRAKVATILSQETIG